MVKNIFDFLFPRLIPHENLTKRQTRQPLILLGWRDFFTYFSCKSQDFNLLSILYYILDYYGWLFTLPKQIFSIFQHNNKEYQFFLIDTPHYIAGSVIYLTSFSFIFVFFVFLTYAFGGLYLLFLFALQLPTFEELSKHEIKLLIFVFLSLTLFTLFIPLL